MGVFSEHLKSKGIYEEKSLPGRPSTNSKIEAKVKMVCQVARASMDQVPHHLTVTQKANVTARHDRSTAPRNPVIVSASILARIWTRKE